MDSPVRLTRSAPPESKSKALLFYDAIDSSAIARSGVLSRIVEAAGDPALPDNITLAEFKTWLTEGNAETETAEQWSFPTFCTVMKVGPPPSWQLLLHMCLLQVARRPACVQNASPQTNLFLCSL